jgi:hypothetical protein
LDCLQEYIKPVTSRREALKPTMIKSSKRQHSEGCSQ